MNKKTAIVTGGTANDVPAMACLVMNIKQTNPNLADEIVIYHDGISKKDQTLITSIFPTRFILYKSPFENVTGFGDVVTKYFSLMVFCKYECFKLLDKYECVIWIDYDVVILEDLSELKNNNNSGVKMITINSVPVKDAFNNNMLAKIDFKKINFSYPGVCMSLFSFTRNLKNYNELYDLCIKKTKELSDSIIYPEQAIINILFQEINIDVEKLSPKIYSGHPTKDSISNNTKILHSYGQPKFWNGIYNETWEDNYKKWIKIGGSPYHQKTLSFKIKKVLKKILKFILPYGFIKIMRFIKEHHNV